MSMVDRIMAPDATGPRRPLVTKKDIWAQFKIDIGGKEVQSAETTSHSWIANQFGHVCLGIILASALSVLLGSGLRLVESWSARWLGVSFSWSLPSPCDNIVGSMLAAIVVAVWEWQAYRIATRGATGRFPLGRNLLRDNAFIATGYMWIGVATAYLYRQFAFSEGTWLGFDLKIWGSACFVVLVLISVRLAVPWLRQKIVWQRAGLPYLFRLADAALTIDEDDARNLNDLINRAPPPEGLPCQIVIGGPIASGRTPLCAGIGTEFAFKKVMVRYLSLATLLEFAARSQHPMFADDAGPANIAYWPWSEAQVLIIDDIGPVLAASAQQSDPYIAQFRELLSNLSPIATVFEKCHTVWVVGDLRGDGKFAKDAGVLNAFASEIGQFCNAKITGRELARKVLVVQLEDVPPNLTARERSAVKFRTRYV
jgi:hypothetical protein